MGLFSQAARTYDLIMDEIGQENSKAEGLAPLFHKAIKIDIIAQINLEGELKNIDDDVKDESGFIPLTEASSQGRSGTKAPPHALIDKVKYLLTDEYLKNLKDWLESTFCNATVKSILNAIYCYMEKGSLKEDLLRYKVASSDKVVGWRIELWGENIETWKSKQLQDSYIAYMMNKQKQSEFMFCMISGKTEVCKPKVRELRSIGKLVSSNDTDNFSYLGRFCEAKEALSLGYVTTQKAINVLEWLLTDPNQCISLGSAKKKSNDNEKRDIPFRVLCWNPSGKEVPRPEDPFDLENGSANRMFPTYNKTVKQYLEGYSRELSIDKRNVVVAILNPTSQGRGSIKYYNEIDINDFISSMESWDKDCCWITRTKKIETPSLYNIVTNAFCGESQLKEKGSNNKDKGNKALWYFYSILIERRINNGRIPIEIVNNLVKRCEKLHVYIGTEADKEKNTVEKLLFITCAVLRKYYKDIEKKEEKMSLNKESDDRSYQWGRLLAVYERIELVALSSKEDKAELKEDEQKKITNAIRMQSVFIHRPLYVAGILDSKLKTAYYPMFKGKRVSSLEYYKKIIGQIFEKLSEIPDGETDKPLKPTYLFGYNLQRNDL